ncbi:MULTISPECIES: hypothetical protein [Pacificibacter]|uniref:hypothetical protein n=1 Tax=Pacificibacter TaxID=1042323 RepID=UPI001C092669|nr:MULTISPECIES: hypothetical protein [Pacificibacter]MBU2937451.1 hypothetical protein [Pacificibacter marinus]MDO6615631.1 hypothetical protein [Pacificibacter sp. 1_MG-2023]
MKYILYGVVILFSLAFTPIALLSVPPKESGPVIAVFAPWADMDSAIKASGTKEIFPIRTVLAAIIDAPSQEARNALKHSGALFILNGDLLAILCGVKNV